MQYQNTSKNGKIGLLTPYLVTNRGNATTARRLIYGLQQNGYDVEVFAYNEEDYTEAVQNRLIDCDCLHIIHYYRFAKWLEKTKTQLTTHIPYVITSGGTDVNENLFNKEQATFMKDVLLAAEVVTVFTEDAKLKIEAEFPELKDKLQIIPQTIWLPDESHASTTQLPFGSPKFLLPAGLRPVKDVLYLKDAFISLIDKYPELQFVIVGPILNRQTYQEVEEFADKYTWAHYIGEIPLDEMKQVYNWADYVLNTSISEGQSSAILEAMYLEKIVLARKNPGNESLISDKMNGILYDSVSDFYHALLNLEADNLLRNKISRAAREHIEQQFNLDMEMDAYTRIFNSIIQRKEV